LLGHIGKRVDLSHHLRVIYRSSEKTTRTEIHRGVTVPNARPRNEQDVDVTERRVLAEATKRAEVLLAVGIKHDNARLRATHTCKQLPSRCLDHSVARRTKRRTHAIAVR
jgi:hypothetical protein